MQEQELVFGQLTLPITILKPQYGTHALSEVSETNILGSRN